MPSHQVKPTEATAQDLPQGLSALADGLVSIYALRMGGTSATWFAGFEVEPTRADIHLRRLFKWLRVNGLPVERPDTAAVIADLPFDEQTWLANAHVKLCVPLLEDSDLVGVAFVHGEGAGPSGSTTTAAVIEWARRATRSLQQILSDERTQRELASAYRSQQLATAGQLAAALAHEIRNPLAAVRSIVQLVRDTTPSGNRQAHLLSDVLGEVDRIDGAMFGLLGIAKPHRPEQKVADVADMTTSAVRFVQPMVQRKGARIAVNIASSVTVRIDPSEFRQVLLNVLLNACEACRAGDSITVTVQSSRVGAGGRGTSRAEVVVADTGEGIPSHLLPRVFEPFFTTKGSGSGLGLGVSRDLFRRYQGDISLVSTPEGTSVTMTLPEVGAD